LVRDFDRDIIIRFKKNLKTIGIRSHVAYVVIVTIHLPKVLARELELRVILIPIAWLALGSNPLVLLSMDKIWLIG
jgi:hypothetical protein